MVLPVAERRNISRYPATLPSKSKDGCSRTTTNLLAYQAKAAAKVDGYKVADRGFIGKFIRYVFDDEDVEFGGGGVDYGADIVRLTD